MKIRTAPDPILYKKATPYKKVNTVDVSLGERMAKELYSRVAGVGIAAPQVGVSKRLIVVDTEYDRDNVEETKNPLILFNPEIVEHSDEMVESIEGCLSCGEFRGIVDRYAKVRVKYLDPEGDPKSIEATGLLSYVLQHEIDHLDGKTILETAKADAELERLKELDAKYGTFHCEVCEKVNSPGNLTMIETKDEKLRVCMNCYDKMIEKHNLPYMDTEENNELKIKFLKEEMKNG